MSLTKEINKLTMILPIRGEYSLSDYFALLQSDIRWVHNADHVAVVAHLVCERLLMLRSTVFGTGEISATMLRSFALYHLATDAVISCNLRKESLKHVGYC
ncbi:hypothetical protein BBC27_09355 [Acidithiobacillus ferrivorans]|uniref:Uncharacterized protein n=1 Tax=Acidithiobacillus ferrivorans TaxID=160808 RepID=A0A1B9BZJ2_9PROT|nr:hypothetical protein BBC27_09355 [Acidithiobacillus ferrivorans]